jgi:hypothetical protein
VIVHAAGLLACNALFLLAGVGVTRAIGCWATPRGLVRMLGLAYLAGVAACGVLLQLLLVLGVRFGVVTVTAAALGLALLGVAGRPAADPAPVRPPWRRIAPLGVVIAGSSLLMTVDLWFQPLGKWDAWAQWTAKARVIYLFHGLEPAILSTQPYFATNPDYPTLLPSIEASDFAFGGAVDTRVIHLQFLLLFLATLAALIQLLTPRAAVLGWSIVALVAVTPAVQVLTASALADIPVALFFAFAGLFAQRWLTTRDRTALSLFALFGAAALATKFEGRIYFAALALVLVVQTVRVARDRLWPTLAACVFAPLAGLLPWSLWVRDHHIRGIFLTSLGDRISFELFSRLGRIPLTVGTLAKDSLLPTEWLLITVAVAVGVFVAARSRSSRTVLELVLATVLVTMAGLIFVYWATPLDPTWHLRQSGYRVIAGPLLFATFLLPALLGEGDEAHISLTNRS